MTTNRSTVAAPPGNSRRFRRAHLAVTVSDPGGKTGHVRYCSGSAVADPGEIGTYRTTSVRVGENNRAGPVGPPSARMSRP